MHVTGLLHVVKDI